MSGTTEPIPAYETHKEIYKTPEERAKIQGDMLRTIQRMKDETANENDMAAFYGESRATTGTLLQKSDDVPNRQVANDRLSLARLYMLKQGVPLETILSQDREAIEEKEKWGKQFRDIIFSRDSKLIADEFKSLTEYVNETVFDPLVLLDDRTLTDNFAKLEIMREGANALLTSMGNSSPIRNAINDNDFNTLTQTARGANATGIVLHSASLKITDESYSKAHSGLRQELGRNLPEHGLTPMEKEHGINAGYELSTRLEHLHAVASKKEAGVPISFMASLEKIIRDTSDIELREAAKKKNNKVDEKPQDYADIYEDLMDFEEYSLDSAGKLTEMPRTLQADRDLDGPATGREAMTLEDFHDEVKIFKQTHKQAQAREAFKPAKTSNPIQPKK